MPDLRLDSSITLQRGSATLIAVVDEHGAVVGYGTSELAPQFVAAPRLAKIVKAALIAIQGVKTFHNAYLRELAETERHALRTLRELDMWP